MNLFFSVSASRPRREGTMSHEARLASVALRHQGFHVTACNHFRRSMEGVYRGSGHNNTRYGGVRSSWRTGSLDLPPNQWRSQSEADHGGETQRAPWRGPDCLPAKDVRTKEDIISETGLFLHSRYRSLRLNKKMGVDPNHPRHDALPPHQQGRQIYIDKGGSNRRSSKVQTTAGVSDP